MRVRLKADGRLVEVLVDGSEALLAAVEQAPMTVAPSIVPEMPGTAATPVVDAAYAKGVRKATRLTQAEFASRIGVPIETVRNWEQGKRAPRGPARALLKLIERVPDVAFAVLGPQKSVA